MALVPEPLAEIRLQTLAQLAAGGRWQIELPHDRDHHLLVWITRGQGTCLLDGAREGFGAHNALFVPARHLMALYPGRGCIGLALAIPGHTGIILPARPRHLRVRDSGSQAELSGLLEAVGREQSGNRPLSTSAIAAWTELVAIWLRRFDEKQEIYGIDSPSRRLCRTYLAAIVERFDSGDNVSNIASRLEFSPEHLTRMCKSATGLTAHELLSGRVEHAARTLVCHSGASFGDISRALGFSSAQSFSRFVRHQTGHSPRALRDRGA
ncbi:AraC family transcriptional regulator [Ruegeria marina]|uniref:Transcriptional regulator, AraC family n=1 Tax=Ruegeria marina TaxID=639004 RepID=A0A1G6JDG4_9RHOB|nr:helix-turn-helix domain-containing protein [Ruegeria marina]SDC16740.1 transcriptional regulator, AraC family [Ruegeria marina]